MDTTIPLPHEQYIPQQENLLKIVILFLLMLICFYLMQELAINLTTSIDGILIVLPFTLLAIFASMLMLAMAILAHDGVHRVLFKNAFINDFVSGVLAAIGGGIPFYANRQFHLTHHSYAHQGENDPEHGMHNAPFWKAIITGSFIGLYLQYCILLKNFWRGKHEKKYPWRSIKDSGFLIIMGLFYFFFLPGIGLSPLYTILPAFLVFPLTFTYRAMSDHYGLPKVKRKSQRYREILENDAEENAEITRQSNQQISGWVVHTSVWLEWLWSHVNYHEVHHKFPYLSHIHLKSAYEKTRETHPYREVNGYTRSLLNLRQVKYYEDH